MKYYWKDANAVKIDGSPAERDFQRCQALEKNCRLDVKMAFSLADNSWVENPEIINKNTFMDVTSNRAWRENLKDDGKLHRLKGNLDKLAFDFIHMPPVCCVF